MRKTFVSIIGLSIAFAFLSFVRAAEPITLESLLTEMTDRAALSQFPVPEYTSVLASSTDTRADSPDGENWFANDDFSHFIRTEERNGNKEYVMLDTDGPGAIVHWWITANAYTNNIYIYVDGATEPTYVAKADDFVGGAFLAEPPLSQEVARGRNLYLPIPYAKHLKVTCDKVGGAEGEISHFYYQINYRTYDKGTEVESFSPEVLRRAQPLMAQVNALLSKPFDSALLSGSLIRDHQFRTEVDPQREQRVMQLAGEGEITEITLKVSAEDLTQALRSTLIQISFDGDMSVCAPIGEFFGSGVGVNSSETWFTQSTDDGTFACHWVMPYRVKAVLSFYNAGKTTVEVQGTLRCQSAPWTQNSLYFHSEWHQERGISTLEGKGTRDWNYVSIDGKGIYLGDSLSLVNRSPRWWGEGDEKIYIDGESHPSHFGTGSEDYYGYAWGTPQKFATPWIAQPRAEGPESFGNVTNLRFRSLDAIPFQKSLKVDMEIWHWAQTSVDYAVTTFWYSDTNGRTASFDFASVYKEASMPVHYETK